MDKDLEALADALRNPPPDDAPTGPIRTDAVRAYARAGLDPRRDRMILAALEENGRDD